MPVKIGKLLAKKKIIRALRLRKVLKSKKSAPNQSGGTKSPSYSNTPAASPSLQAPEKRFTLRKMNEIPSPDRIGQILVAKKIITSIDLDKAIERKKREPAKYLGQILCEMGLPQSKIMKSLYYSNKRKKLGEILVDLNIITAQQLQDALSQQKNHKNRGIHRYLGTLLVRNRIISEKNYVQALSAHLSLPVVSLKDYRVSPALQKAVGEDYALTNRIVVLSNNPRKMVVAIAEPHMSVFEYLEKAMPKDKYILFCLARASEIEVCLDKQYDPFHF